MPLTDIEKARVRLYLGYPLQHVNAGLNYGNPINLQSSFLLDKAFGLVSEDSCDLIRRYLAYIEELEQDLQEKHLALIARRAEEMDLAEDFMEKMQQLSNHWACKIAQILYVPFNPDFSGLSRTLATGGGRNLGVS